jgi:hypothetical protein
MVVEDSRGDVLQKLTSHVKLKHIAFHLRIKVFAPKNNKERNVTSVISPRKKQKLK